VRGCGFIYELIFCNYNIVAILFLTCYYLCVSKADKLLQRFLSKPRDFTFYELRNLLKGFGYEEAKTGKTSGSRVSFYNADLDDMIKFHKPHPSQIIKQCYLRDIEQQLRDKGVLK